MHESGLPLRLTPAESPLVELAEHLGYSVVLSAETHFPSRPHYCIVNEDSALLVEGDQLVSVLAALYREHRADLLLQMLTPQQLSTPQAQSRDHEHRDPAETPSSTERTQR